MSYNDSLFSELKNEAHVWLAKPNGFKLSFEEDKYLNMLSTHEKGRFHRYKSRSDKHMYLSAHVLLRTTLSKYVDIDPGKWMFERNKFGRPEIVSCLNRYGLRFSISHTEGLSACVITDKIDCGVDVEIVRHIEGIGGIAKNYFSKREAEDLEYYTDIDKLRKFFDIWTLKEAYAKAKGVGLNFPSRSISFSVDKKDSVSVMFERPLEDSRLDWQFGIFNLYEKHKMAIAIRQTFKDDKKIILKNI